MTKKKETPTVETSLHKRLPIKWNIPENIVTRFATNMLVQTISDEEFKISFFELKPAVTFSEDDLALSTEVPAVCVASIIVTPDRLSSFVEVLQRQLETYKAKKKSS